jgi:hypothetical protein
LLQGLHAELKFSPLGLFEMTFQKLLEVKVLLRKRFVIFIEQVFLGIRLSCKYCDVLNSNKKCARAELSEELKKQKIM